MRDNYEMRAYADPLGDHPIMWVSEGLAGISFEESQRRIPDLNDPATAGCLESQIVDFVECRHEGNDPCKQWCVTRLAPEVAGFPRWLVAKSFSEDGGTNGEAIARTLIEQWSTR